MSGYLKHLKDPKIQLAISLLLIFSATLLRGYPLSQLSTPFIVIASTIIFDFVFLKIRKKNLFFPSAAIASGLIISLIINPSAPWYVLITAAFAAIFSKNFIRPTRHIFNPAAFGMMAIALLFSSPTAWWGPGILFGSPLLIALLIPGLVSFYRMRRYFTIVVFYITYSLLLVLFFGLPLQAALTDPTTLFFTLVMAPEPMTTPAKRNNQILFALSLVIIAFAYSKLLIGVPFINRIDPFIFALLLGNLIFFKRR